MSENTINSFVAFANHFQENLREFNAINTRIAGIYDYIIRNQTTANRNIRNNETNHTTTFTNTAFTAFPRTNNNVTPITNNTEFINRFNNQTNRRTNTNPRITRTNTVRPPLFTTLFTPPLFPGNNQDTFANIFNTFTNNTGGFLDPVPVLPTNEQVNVATELVNINDIDTTQTHCPIDLVPFTENENVTRILHCGHVFRTNNITAWFRNSSRCPLCRYDVREYRAQPNNNTRDEPVENNENNENNTENNTINEELENNVDASNNTVSVTPINTPVNNADTNVDNNELPNNPVTTNVEVTTRVMPFNINVPDGDINSLENNITNTITNMLTSVLNQPLTQQELNWFNTYPYNGNNNNNNHDNNSNNT